jgi:uncharacterized membrane protein YhdT
MLWWLIGVAVFVLIWGRLWQTQPKLAFGVLLGLILAWIFSRYMRPYITGMEQIPLWLPPLPFAIVAITLLVAGALIWLRADNLPPVKQPDEDPHTHGGHH